MDLHAAHCRALLGHSAVLWAGDGGVDVRSDSWIALSGIDSVVYNAAVVYGGGKVLEAMLDEVIQAKVPAVVAVAGMALGEVERLVARGWRCIGSAPLMALDLTEGVELADCAAVRRLTSADHPQARTLIGDVFGVGPELAGVAFAGVAHGLEGHVLWGAFDGDGTLLSCLAAVRVQDTVAIWSAATTPAMRGRGYARAVLGAALADAAATGATTSVLSSSEIGEPLYRALGYREIERWQQWSRPRWVLGRA